MALFRGIVGKIVAILLLLVILLIVWGIYLYASDYRVKATVTETDCNMAASTVTVKTKTGGFSDIVQVTRTECAVIDVGNFVEYHIRSGRTVIYEKENGPCVYDTSHLVC
jgi:hypothetical protein